MSTELLSIDAAAERMGVSTRTIHRWMRDGTITGYRVGPKLIRVKADDLDALLEPIPTTGSAS